MKSSIFTRVVTSVAASALLAAGAVVSIAAPATAAPPPAPTSVGDNPLACRNNIPDTDFVADPYDPDLTGVLSTDLYLLTDKARVSAGQEPYVVSNLLTSEARSWARTGSPYGDLPHASNTMRQRSLPTGFTNEGENIFSGNNGRKAAYIFTAWMDSELHRANLLCPTFTHIGSGSNSPSGGARRHLVQRFAAYPESINPDDATTWFPLSMPQPNSVSRSGGTVYSPDTELLSLTSYEQAALTRINQLRTSAGVQPLVAGTTVMDGLSDHLDSYALGDWMTQVDNKYAIDNDEGLETSTLVGSGTGASEMVMSRVTDKDGDVDVDHFFNKGAAWKNIILDPEWTHFGAGQAALLDYGYAYAYYSGLRFASYPEPAVQNNSWNSNSLSIPAKTTAPAQTVVIESAGDVYLQTKEDGDWVTKDTFVAHNGEAVITFPTFNKSGTHDYRLVSPAKGLEYYEWVSPVLNITVTKIAQDNSWAEEDFTTVPGEAPTVVAKVQSGGKVALQQKNGSSWTLVEDFTVANGEATIKFPVQTVSGSEDYRLHSLGNGTYLPWTSNVITVTATIEKADAPNSFNSTALATTVGKRPANGTATIHENSSVELQELRGDSWVKIETFSVTNNEATVQFPVQDAVGTANYRLRTEGTANYKAWNSSVIKVATTKATANNTFSTTTMTTVVGSRPANRVATIQGSDTVDLQELQGSTWKSVKTFSVSNNRATIQFPVQSSTGVKNYRLNVAESMTHAGWVSGTVRVASNKANQNSSWNSSRTSMYYGSSLPSRTAVIEAKGNVYVQQYVSGNWKNIKTFNAASGQVSVTVPDPKIGKHSYRLYSPGNSKYNSWNSGTYNVTTKARKQSVHSIGKSDFSGNGHADLLSVNRHGMLYVLVGNGKGKVTKTYTGKRGYQNDKLVVAVGDLTGDGHSDLLRVKRNGKAYITPGLGNNKFSSKSIFVGRNFDTYKDVFSPGDINGDGYGDIVIRNRNGNMYVYYGNGDGTFKSHRKLNVNWKKYRSVSSGGDYNGSKKADIILVTKSGKVVVARGNNRGGFKNITLKGGFKNLRNISVGGNLNGGKYSDVITVDSIGRVRLHSGNGKTLKKGKMIAKTGHGAKHLS